MLLQKSKLYERRLFDFSISQLIFNDKILKEYSLSTSIEIPPVLTRDNIDLTQDRINLMNSWESLSHDVIAQCENSVCMYLYIKCEYENNNMDYCWMIGEALRSKKYGHAKYIIKRYKEDMLECEKYLPLSICATEEDLPAIKFLMKHLPGEETLDVSGAFKSACEKLNKEIAEYFYRDTDLISWDMFTEELSKVLLSIIFEKDEVMLEKRRDFAKYMGNYMISKEVECGGDLVRNYLVQLKNNYKSIFFYHR